MGWPGGRAFRGDSAQGSLAQDPPEPLDFSALAQVLGGEGVTETVGSDAKARPRSDRSEQFGQSHDAFANPQGSGSTAPTVASRSQ